MNVVGVKDVHCARSSLVAEDRVHAARCRGCVPKACNTCENPWLCMPQLQGLLTQIASVQFSGIRRLNRILDLPQITRGKTIGMS